MTNKKLTDNEIKKALECCIISDCPNCPMGHRATGTYNEHCGTDLMKNALDLINRKDAENERLRKENGILSENADAAFQDGLNENQALFEKTILKDFVKELKEKADEFKQVRLDGKWAVSQYDIDKLLKEKIGDNNG